MSEPIYTLKIAIKLTEVGDEQELRRSVAKQIKRAIRALKPKLEEWR